jgi:hypothetical protein
VSPGCAAYRAASVIFSVYVTPLDTTVYVSVAVPPLSPQEMNEIVREKVISSKKRVFTLWGGGR